MNKLFSALVAKRIVATVSALIVIAIGCGAGFWQLGRAETKIALETNLAARLQMPVLNANREHSLTLEEAGERRMMARGRYIPEAAIWLDNRPRPIPAAGSSNSQAGFYLMMPMRLEGRDEILWINRGWAPRNNENREALPPVQTPTKTVDIEGVVFAHPGKVYELGGGGVSVDSGKPRIEQNFDLVAEGKARGWSQYPFILRELDVGADDGLLREWAPLASGVDRHYAYAFQWFALAFVGFLFWLLSGLRQYQVQRFANGDQE